MSTKSFLDNAKTPHTQTARAALSRGGSFYCAARLAHEPFRGNRKSSASQHARQVSTQQTHHSISERRSTRFDPAAWTRLARFASRWNQSPTPGSTVPTHDWRHRAGIFASGGPPKLEAPTQSSLAHRTIPFSAPHPDLNPECTGFTQNSQTARRSYRKSWGMPWNTKTAHTFPAKGIVVIDRRNIIKAWTAWKVHPITAGNWFFSKGILRCQKHHSAISCLLSWERELWKVPIGTSSKYGDRVPVSSTRELLNGYGKLRL